MASLILAIRHSMSDCFAVGGRAVRGKEGCAHHQGHLPCQDHVPTGMPSEVEDHRHHRAGRRGAWRSTDSRT
ncbi:hypothetical protein JZ751_013440 [Albula glossodonta]|uniref:Uncharacterized protein n=1 Tax=Albula glossodonta TaxID=121402 RepID=A0A8T2MZE6_9TELE|nr:hypothetical protein JZ751_013440 [Albula glossodonta]